MPPQSDELLLGQVPSSGRWEGLFLFRNASASFLVFSHPSTDNKAFYLFCIMCWTLELLYFLRLHLSRSHGPPSPLFSLPVSVDGTVVENEGRGVCVVWICVLGGGALGGGHMAVYTF